MSDSYNENMYDPVILGGTCGRSDCEKCLPENDPVNHPAHYNRGKIEVLDFIEDQGLGYHLGQVIKYVARAGFKDTSTYRQDLEKAAFYLAREIRNAS